VTRARESYIIRYILAVVGICLSCAYWTSTAKGGEQPPNIVFILADDLGYSGLGCYGNTYHETPNLDRLAADGMRFTQAYSPAPICSASRIAFLTGRSPARLNFEFVTKRRKDKPPADTTLAQPPFTYDLPLSEISLAEALGPAGYATGFFGKWHVNEHYKRYLGYSPTHGPAQQGFGQAVEDRGSHPYAYKKREFGDFAEGELPEDALTQGAVDFLKSHRDERFFLYVSHYYVHDPVHTKCRWLHEKYEKKADPESPWHNPTYGAFVETLDRYVGIVLDEIDQLGLRDNTVVIFTSDNGAHPGFTSNYPLRGNKWNLYEGGIHVPMMVRWPGVVEPGSTCDVPVIGTDLMPTLCEIAETEPAPDRPLDGVSIVPLLHEKPIDRDTLVWHFPYYHPPQGYEGTTPQSAIRQGDYKLLYFYEEDRTELYDLAKDPAEQHDLSRTEPERTKEIRQSLADWLDDVGARYPTERDSQRPVRIRSGK
jgi:arylsulfatase A